MVFYVFSKSVMIGHTWNHFILRYLLIIISKSLGRVGNGNPSVGVDCVFVLIVGTLLLNVKHAEVAYENPHRREALQLFGMYQIVPKSQPFEDTYENSHWRKTLQMFKVYKDI